MSRLLRHTRPFAPIGSRCDVCKGEGLVELAPLPDGRMACPVCRHTHHVRLQDSGQAPPYDREAEAQEEYPE